MNAELRVPANGRRAKGIILLLVIYIVANIAVREFVVLFNQSLLTLAIPLVILPVVWVSTAVVLNKMVLERRPGNIPVGRGFCLAFLLMVLWCGLVWAGLSLILPTLRGL